ncbi:MAG: hypothetical protein HY924_09965 [Elusimicrobia bacterium]|nr:hypothetical protein [Elusimicrobiota bacterium]
MTHTFEIRAAADLLDAQSTAVAWARGLGLNNESVAKVLFAVAESAEQLLTPAESPALITIRALRRKGQPGFSLTMETPAVSRVPRKVTVWRAGPA